MRWPWQDKSEMDAFMCYIQKYISSLAEHFIFCQTLSHTTEWGVILCFINALFISLSSAENMLHSKAHKLFPMFWIFPTQCTTKQHISFYFMRCLSSLNLTLVTSPVCVYCVFECCLSHMKVMPMSASVGVIKLSAWRAGLDVSWLSSYQRAHTPQEHICR